MTVSGRPTQNGQEPEPQHSGVQQPQSSVARPQGESVGNPQQFPESIRRRVVGKPAGTSPAGASVTNSPNAQRANAGVAPARQASLRRDVSLRTANKHEADPQEIENGSVILYRHPNFFLRTAYRPGQKQKPLHKPTGNTRVMPHQESRIADSETRMMPNDLHVKRVGDYSGAPFTLPLWLRAPAIGLDANCGLDTTYWRTFHLWQCAQ